MKWIPWRWLVSRIARRRGLVDPIRILSRLESFAQPLEIKEPLELLRAGMAFHARGLLNTGAIQHNLDWIWPYWVERQFNPRDEAFIPRAFSITHVNLTLRNWTAVGRPGFDELPIVDPRGLVTPFWDGWSLDLWLFADDGRHLVPSRLADGAVHQSLHTDGGLAVLTVGASDGLELRSRVFVTGHGRPTCRLELSARCDRPARLAVALRPYNPEGVSLIRRIRPRTDSTGWQVDGRREVLFSEPAQTLRASDYKSGDVWHQLAAGTGPCEARCSAGMASAAALFALEAGRTRSLEIRVPLDEGDQPGRTERSGWSRALAGAARLEVADPLIRSLYDAALRSLVLHSPGREVYPGPFTYKRFWFRDAAFILHALLCAGLDERAARCLRSFPDRQTASGFFLSQEGEWDSNGEALWIMKRFCDLTGQPLPESWRRCVRRGARWIQRQRLDEQPPSPHAGLLPAGFSAEHLGPNDFYYWDDFWGVAGLRAAADLSAAWGDDGEAAGLREEAASFLRAIEESLSGAAARLGTRAMPASPYRRLDAGSIGSLAVGYPLQLWPADDERLIATAEHLLGSCWLDGGFFQDIIHSGINPYLTLHVAQVLLRAGDPRWLDAVATVARLASPTGQWPEAIHPRTRGGCMGDGHHVWAAAEWVLMVRNSFLREEDDRLVLASGIPPDWIDDSRPATFGPAPTPFGPVTVSIERRGEGVEVRWHGAWRGDPPPIEVRWHGHEPSTPEEGGDRVMLMAHV